MKNKGWVLLFIMMALLASACGKQETGGQIAAPSAAVSTIPASTALSEDFKQLYRTSVFLGDSITEGLSYHDVLNGENVLAGAGKTAEITLMEDDVDQLAARKPKHVFIQLGSTDILWPVDNPQEHSLLHYKRLIETIQAKLPDATLSLLSVTPVTAEAEKLEPRYGNIAEYNEGLQALAEKKQVSYVELTPLVAEHADLYDTDGIHFQAEFYPYLLEYLKSAIQ